MTNYAPNILISLLISVTTKDTTGCYTYFMNTNSQEDIKRFTGWRHFHFNWVYIYVCIYIIISDAITLSIIPQNNYFKCGIRHLQTIKCSCLTETNHAIVNTLQDNIFATWYGTKREHIFTLDIFIDYFQVLKLIVGPGAENPK